MRASFSVPPRCRLTSPHAKTLSIMGARHSSGALLRRARMHEPFGRPQGRRNWSCALLRASLHRLPQRLAVGALDAGLAGRLVGLAHAELVADDAGDRGEGALGLDIVAAPQP